MNQIRMASRCIVVVFFGAGLLLARAALADTEEGARKHASKANQLAARNKCKPAIFEYTRALKTLKDPSLFFNRAECFRKVGRNDEAIKDYEELLAEMPDAPNRAVVQARIAALRGAAAGTPKSEPARGAGKATPAVPEKAPAAPAKGTPAKPADKTLAVPTLAPPAPLAKPADKTLAVPTLAPAAKPAEKAPAAPPAAPSVKPAEKPAAPPASPVKSAEKVPAAAPAAPAPVPARRAEKWTD